MRSEFNLSQLLSRLSQESILILRFYLNKSTSLLLIAMNEDVGGYEYENESVKLHWKYSWMFPNNGNSGK